MEDPWASGSGWNSTPAKSGPSLTLPASLNSPPRQSTFDEADADPWAVPSSSSAPAPPPPSSPPRPSPPRLPSWTASDGGGWGAPDPTPPLPREEALPDVLEISETVDRAASSAEEETSSEPEPVWKLDSPKGSSHDTTAEDIPLPSTPLQSLPPSHVASPHTPRPSFSPPLHRSPFAAEDPTESFGTPKRGSIGGSPDFGAFGAFDESAFPRSTSFGAGFGQTSYGDGDPWGGGAGAAGPSSPGATTSTAGGGWGESPVSPVRKVDPEEEGWGGVESRTVVEASKSGMDEEWEVAQARMRVLAERAPPERIERIRADWRELVAGVIGMHKLEGLTPDEEEQLESAVRKIAAESTEALHSLTTLPPDTNTYPPVLSSLETHKTYLTQLSRPNPTPSTSLFINSTQRRTRRTELSSENAWTSRSRLGEPDVPKEAIPTEEPTRSKWSFWYRKAPERPLVTSGGGVLEVKAAPISLAAPLTPAPPSASERPSISRSASIASGRPSRPSSPAVVADDGHHSPGGTLSPGAGPSAGAGPSGLGRFFGRLRKSSTQMDVDAKDMELTDDDFGFLAEVPSIPPPQPKGMGDLLSLDSGATNLETMLASNPAPLPVPLAPPPRPTSASGRFVARMTKPVAPVRDVDLLGGLDFDGGDISTPGNSGHQASSGGWEEFLAPAQAPSAPAAKSDGFDDFGDFDAFSSAPPKSNGTAPAPISFNHTPAMTLVHEAVASKGKRWPAPPSPVAPILEPPPKAAPASTGFPFLSPPPPGRGARPNDLMAEGDSPAPPSAAILANMGGALAPPMQATGSGSSLAPSLLAPSSRSTTPAVPPPPIATNSKQGLSAQDLSFFDSL